MLDPFYPPCVIDVECLYSLHYFPFACGYLFSGESHPFWEMVYVDRGEADIGAGDQVHRLSQGQAIFHHPGEFHSIWANSCQGTNIFVVTFTCNSPSMAAFRRRVSLLAESQRKLIARMVKEGQRAFGPVLDVPLRRGMVQREGASQASAQMVVVLLTQLLLELLAKDQAQHGERPALTENADFAPVMERIVRLMRAHPSGNLRFEDICHEAGFGETALKERFKHYTGTTVIAYYQRLRLEESRRLLRQGHMSISRVAAELGYSSPQAFSRQFKRMMGVCPADYLKMVKE